MKTSLAPGSKVVTDYLKRAGLRDLSRSARLQPGRLRLHHLHRQQRSAARRGLGRDPRARPGRRVGAERQPQLRGPHPAAGARQLPGLAAAGGGLRAGRVDEHRPHHRAARHRHGRPAGVPEGHLADRAGDSGRRCCTSVTSERSAQQYASVFDGDERWQKLPVPTGDRFAWDDDSTYIRKPPFFENLSMTPAPLTDIGRRARAGGARRQHHHRSHLAGRQHQGGQPGGQVPDRARRDAEGLQLLRRAARQPRGDDARHVRQHPPQEPAGARHRRRRDHATCPAAR